MRHTTTFHYDVGQNQFGFNLSLSGGFTQLLIILITPLTAIMTAQLYLKTREAGGEGVKESIQKFYAEEMPTSKWQQKMTSRIRL
jgi:hypothetical protein